MFEYKVLCGNYPLDKADLNRFGQEGWEFVGVCTLQPDDEAEGHIVKPAAMIEQGAKVRYLWYFRRMTDD